MTEGAALVAEIESLGEKLREAKAQIDRRFDEKIVQLAAL